MAPNSGKVSKALLLVRSGKLGLAAYMLYYRALKTQKRLGRHPLDKGSKRCLEALSGTKFVEPSFLYVNLMEAHDPYFYDEGDFFRYCQFAYLTGSRYDYTKFDVRTRYPKHARLSMSRLMEMMTELRPLLDRSLVIVTSDHGQMLGERGKYWHGYFLDDELLRVPLYLRFPKSCLPVKQNAIINLKEIPEMIQHVVAGSESPYLGSEASVAESFGALTDLSYLAKNDEQSHRFSQTYSWRIKLYTSKGCAVYNRSTNSFEEIQGSLQEDEAREWIKRLDKGPVAKDQGTLESAEGKSSGLTNTEEEEIRNKLKALGYL